MTAITKSNVLSNILKLNKELNRPTHLADLKASFNVLEKRESARRKTKGKAENIRMSVLRLFKEGKISKSESLVRVEDYPASPYSTVRKTITTNVYLYAPIEYAGKFANFKLNGHYITPKFVSYEMVKDCKDERTKKEMVLEILPSSERALTVNEILEKINEKYDAYDVSTKRKFYNATSSLTRAVLKPLRKKGLRGRKIGHVWVWYFKEEQLDNYREYYIQNNPVINLSRDLLLSKRCVPLSRILSELQITPEEAKYHIRKVGKEIPLEIETEKTKKGIEVHLQVGRYRRDSFVDWLGMAVPESKKGYGYETMLVYLDSDWEDALLREIKKSFERTREQNLIGSFYEKLVARLFNILCTSRELQNSNLSKYMIPFVFRDEKVGNVWLTLDSGRRVEFDVLLRGTFKAFDAMTDGKYFLDLIIPIESKYTKVEPQHVTIFDEKVRKAFNERNNVIPIMIGLNWTEQALHLTRRFGILTIYFSSITKLVRAMTGTRYRFEHEWKKASMSIKEGKLTEKELRFLLDNQEYKFIFEEYLDKRLSTSKAKS